jgi:hypothetical protein
LMKIHKIIISIDDGSEFEISYGNLCRWWFYNFVTDSNVCKGTKAIKFIKTDRRNRVFELNFVINLNNRSPKSPALTSSLKNKFVVHATQMSRLTKWIKLEYQ